MSLALAYFPEDDEPRDKDSLPGQFLHDTQLVVARQGINSDSGQSRPDTHIRTAAVGSTSPQAMVVTTPTEPPPVGNQATDRDQNSSDTHVASVSVGPVSVQDLPANAHTSPNHGLLADPALAFAADVLDDLERVRNANANRLRSLTATEPDEDGVMRGFGLDESHPDVARLAVIVTTMDALVHDATLQLQRQMRKHPLGPWAKAQRGIGEKQAARLLAAIGDPYWHTLHNQPRTVSQLWAYCGLKPGQKRTKGQKSNWSTIAKSRSWCCVESCMKQIDATCKGEEGIGRHLDGCKCSPYRIKVDQHRTRTLLTHPEWKPGHSLNDGMRVASKELLKDLWREAKRIHEED